MMLLSTPLLANNPVYAQAVQVISPMCPRNSNVTVGGWEATFFVRRPPMKELLPTDGV